MKDQNFKDFADGLVEKEVEVITFDGTYTGRLLSVGSDSIFVETTIQGRSVQLAIRISFIVALFQLVPSTRRGPFWAPYSEVEEENEGETN
ncbi:hypothetical protein [Bacillus sp. FJAT-50079]|uniref:hypothetical protein n=1 Tax=Bacillus sp. FJAT-50079 TaxID=2833577 RepID=UPI001BC91BFC|nr:hypothetical protein [Bacillus sp. FJAT-50079]MBS4208680.1 hypothetical protein [Bacillus sp. FJAT-50079]